jgi:hypothetical protein
MKTFKEFVVENQENEDLVYFIESLLLIDSEEDLTEGNANQKRVNKHLSAGRSIGIVSHEGPHTDTPARKSAAETHIKSHLEAAKKAGHIGGWSGPHKGQYKYADGPKDIAKEGSFVVYSAGHSKEHHETLKKTIKHIGNVHNQESVLTAHPKDGAKLHFLKRSPRPNTTRHLGGIAHNKELTTGSGNTEFKKGKSITTKHIPYAVRGGKKVLKTAKKKQGGKFKW